jgi:hypothetical protein
VRCGWLDAPRIENAHQPHPHHAQPSSAHTTPCPTIALCLCHSDILLCSVRLVNLYLVGACQRTGLLLAKRSRLLEVSTKVGFLAPAPPARAHCRWTISGVILLLCLPVERGGPSACALEAVHAAQGITLWCGWTETLHGLHRCREALIAQAALR